MRGGRAGRLFRGAGGAAHVRGPAFRPLRLLPAGLQAAAARPRTRPQHRPSGVQGRIQPVGYQMKITK